MNYIINGGNKLGGRITVGSAKNCVLVLLASCVLADGTSTVNNIEPIDDVLIMLEILTSLGCKVSWSGSSVSIDTTTIHTTTIPTHLAMQLRGSVFLLGALLARFHRAITCMPGGCAIGARPIDIHVEGLEKLGVKVDICDNCIECEASDIVGCDIHLRMPSVGATENIVMCAVLAKGRTTITNCACEPEVVSLMRHLVAMGADISGIGTSSVVIEGKSQLTAVSVNPIADRIVASTYLVAGALTHSDIIVDNCNYCHVVSLVNILQNAGVNVSKYNNSIRVRSNGYAGLGNIITGPYPLFATDMQSLVLAMATVSSGNTTITETMFENRLSANCSQLNKLGANITVDDSTAYITGVKSLLGTEVVCSDLRGGASLVLAGLVAQGTTVVKDIFHISRGYYQLDKCLQSIGANIVVR